MALREKKAEAIRMRKEGASYTQIKEKVGVSKSTLSLWLQAYPLSEERIRELRDRNPIRIERYRETRRKAREARQAVVRKQVAREIGSLTKRDLLIGGLFLYWGEGTKTAEATTSVSNTDPAMLVYFIEWLRLLGIPKERIRVRVHLYSDMDVESELGYWSEVLGIPRSNFGKPYIKASLRSGLSYSQRFTHGTCNVLFHNKNIFDKTLFGLEHIRSTFAPRITL